MLNLDSFALHRYTPLALFVGIALALPAVGCSTESENGACGWLFAPPSFVDAGQRGCTARPAGRQCDPTERCDGICGSDEYLLTCLADPEPRAAIAEEVLEDPGTSGGDSLTCKRIVIAGKPTEETSYCCRCAP